MEKILHKKIASLLILLIFLSNVSVSSAQSSNSKEVKREKERFIENQVSYEDLYFLNSLVPALYEFKKVNNFALGMLEAFPVGENTSHSSFTGKIVAATKKAATQLRKSPKSYKSIKGVIDVLFEGDLELAQVFEDTVSGYHDLRDFAILKRNYSKNHIALAASVHSFTIYQDSLADIQELKPENILPYAIKNYDTLAKLSQERDIGKIQKALTRNLELFKASYAAIEFKIIDPLEITNRCWEGDIIVRTLRQIQQQLLLNYHFSNAIMRRLMNVAIPVEPALPDLELSSIGVLSPEQLGVGSKVKIIVAVTNLGQLSSPTSTIKIILPDGLQRKRSLHRLSAGQTYWLKWNYKLPAQKTTTIKAVVNYDNDPWEENMANNELKRELIFVR